MQTKFIKLKFRDIVQYINPVFITNIVQTKEQCVVYTMDGRSAYSDETAEEIINKINKASTFTFTF
jgi:hypothetical protein